MSQLTQEHIIRLFNIAYPHGRHIMTPDIVRYGTCGEYLYELSVGSGFAAGSKMYGVTMLTRTGDRTEHSHGGFATESDANCYIAQFDEDEEE